MINPLYDDKKEMFEPVKLTDNVSKHKELVNELNVTYADKNKKYGDSFADTVKRYGQIAALTRMSDKFSRIEQFILNGYEDDEEGLRDSLMDLANYCLMTVMLIEEE